MARKNPHILIMSNTKHEEPDPKKIKENALRQHIKFSTDLNNHHIRSLTEKLKMYNEDPDKEERLKKQLCRYCEYMRRGAISGQAFTDAYCIDCGTQMTFCNTDTDDLCMDCAKKHNVCKHCGAEMD